jgi:putative N-acetyltransferase (TIGR04045 family)
VSTTYSPPLVASLRLAADAVELAGHFAVRRAMFVERQRLFEDDRDERDADALHAVAVLDGEVVGAVRLYPLSGTLWKGDRLAVLPGHRAGADLVKFAVRTAAERGGARMVAQVQVANVGFFERLGWVKDGEPARYRGVMHQPMAIALALSAASD